MERIRDEIWSHSSIVADLQVARFKFLGSGAEFKIFTVFKITVAAWQEIGVHTTA